MAIEEPRYTVLISEPPFEVRRYAAFTVAQTQIQGDFDAASRSGFGALRPTFLATTCNPSWVRSAKSP